MQGSHTSSKMRKQRTHRRTGTRGMHGHSPRLTTELDVRIGVFRQPAMQTPVLVLNASYEPINICGARRALVLVLKGVARTEEEQGAVLHAARMNVAMPSVIRLLEYRRIPHQTRALSRKNILLRDRNSCQYCGVVLTAGELTLDHVIPRSRGGAVDVGEPGRVLPRLQPDEGQSVAARADGHEAAARAAVVQPAHVAAHHADDRVGGSELATVSVLRIGAGRLAVLGPVRRSDQAVRRF